MSAAAYWIKGVRLETGFIYEGEAAVGTETRLANVRIEEGKFSEISFEPIPEENRLPVLDADGALLLPALKDMHIHLDKTYFGGPWQAVRPAKSIFDRIEEERRLIPRLLPFATERAEKILELLLENGTTFVRGHVNVEPISGMRGLEAVLKALEGYSDKLECELVAFPQHGLLYSKSADLVKQAMGLGATHLGGLDPTFVDGDMESSLQAMMEIAVETNSPVDMHLHEQGAAGLAVMNRLADLTAEAGWQGRVTVSHAFGFASASAGEAEELAERFAESGISIASTVPIGRSMMPIPMLSRKGVKVEFGTDSLTDHWSPFGKGDMLEKAGRLAELYGYTDEFSLSRSLGYGTGGITPLNERGDPVWPAVGDAATGVFVRASCSAEAVARRSDRQATLRRGKIASGSLGTASTTE